MLEQHLTIPREDYLVAAYLDMLICLEIGSQQNLHLKHNNISDYPLNNLTYLPSTRFISQTLRNHYLNYIFAIYINTPMEQETLIPIWVRDKKWYYKFLIN